MKKLIFAILFIAFSTGALAEAQLGESQNPPSKSTAGGCSFARVKKSVEASSAPKAETKKAQTMDIKSN